MGQWLDAHDAAAAVFDEAEAAGFAARDVCCRTSSMDLRRTDATQPAILSASVATWAVLGSRGVHCSGVAGHSLGEYGALVAARVLTFLEALEIVRRRGQIMADAGKGLDAGMAAVIGLDADEVQRVCREATTNEASTVVVANHNAPGQVVISGLREGLDRAATLAIRAGARRVVPLPVSGAFHSPLMADAERALGPVIDVLDFRSPEVAFYPNVTGTAERDPERIRRLAVQQVTSPVLWEQTVSRMRSDGVEHFVEVGPGTVLAGLVRRTCPEATVWSTNNEQALEEVVDALAEG